MKKTGIILSFAVFIFIFCPLAGVLAAEIYFDPSSATVAPDDLVSIKIKIDPEIKECINAAEIEVIFSEDLSFEDFSVGESIFSLWIERPSNDGASLINKSRRLVFSGGIPGGYCGTIVGDSGESNILGELHFRTGAIAAPEGYQTAYVKISDSSKVYLNDGAGTEISVPGAEANIRLDRRAALDGGAWTETLEGDKILPEPFVININEYQGRKFAAFSTTDKQTGIDHYEIMEASIDDINAAKPGFFAKLFGRQEKILSWKIVESPYYLEDQELKSVIKIKAVDKAGNERIVEYQNQDLRVAMSGQKEMRLSPYLLPAILAGLIIILVVLALRARKR